MTIVDTDILIDVARGVQEAIDCLQNIQANSVFAISAVTQMELIMGCRNNVELQKLDSFLKSSHIIQINEAVSEKSVELLRNYRLSHGLLIADSLIAATALIMNVPLISKNQRDYKFIVGLQLLPYP